jgi:hypothetical protein
MSAAAFADHRDAGPRRPYDLTLDALVGPTGTDVVLKVTGGQALPREAEHVFLWSTSRHGHVVWAQHFKDVALVDGVGVLAGLAVPAHARISAMVEVKVAGSHRVQVLSANTVAMDRPDLRISRVDAPAEVRVGQTANIEVLVQEARGYRGARFDVLLLEGATLLDSVLGASIDAMGSTTAMFSVRFETEGAHALTASIVNAAPGEYDATNNSSSFTIRATSDAVPVSYSMAYQRIEGEFSDNVTISTTKTVETPGSSEVRVTEQETRYEEIGRHETLNYSAFSDRFVDGTIGVTLTIRIDGGRDVSIAVSGWTPLKSDGGADFGSASYPVYDPDTNANLYLESQWSAKGASSVLQYSRVAGNYTYHSSGYDRFWSQISVTDPVTGDVVTTVTSGETTSNDSGTVVIGSFLDAFQKLQVRAEVDFGGGALGGWTAEHEVLMSAVDRTWDKTSSDSSQTIHAWGYERRTFWDAQGNGVTVP